MASMKFKDLAVGQRFDFINDGAKGYFTFNSFRDRCAKISARKYCSLDRAMPDMQVGSVNVIVYHVSRVPTGK